MPHIQIAPKSAKSAFHWATTAASENSASTRPRPRLAKRSRKPGEARSWRTPAASAGASSMGTSSPSLPSSISASGPWLEAATTGRPCAQAWITTLPKGRSEEHTSELQSHLNLVCRLLLEKKKKNDVRLTRSRRRKVRVEKKTET